MNGRIFRSTFTDPYLNLSFEHHLFKTLKDRRLLLYVNDPCVVIGRNQNPWRECNIPLLRQLGIPLVRRWSGGGTVVHDRGNVNFSVMMPREEFSREKHAKMIVDKMNSLPEQVQRIVPRTVNEPNSTPDLRTTGNSPFSDSSDIGEDCVAVNAHGPQVKLALNERYDIVTKEDKRKVSGSAYKIQRQKAYHHGTMLLNSKLDVLSALLHRNVNTLGTVEGRGVESVKSPVANIGCDTEVFIDAVIEAYREEYRDDTAVDRAITVSEDDLPQEVLNEAAEMRSWDWAYAQTPPFEHTLTHPEHDYPVKFSVNKGIVTSMDPMLGDGSIVGKRYTPENAAGLGDWIANAL